MRLPSEILPVVGVVTLGFVVFFIERAPFGFEIKHVKVIVFLHQMDDPSFNILLGVSE